MTGFCNFEGGRGSTSLPNFSVIGGGGVDFFFGLLLLGGTFFFTGGGGQELLTLATRTP